jgi:hypothetical protein
VMNYQGLLHFVKNSWFELSFSSLNNSRKGISEI